MIRILKFLCVLTFLVILSPKLLAETIITDDLIISEYVHLPGNNGGDKAVEIYNGTHETIELSEYSLRLYVNGAVVGADKNVKYTRLEGTLLPGEVHIVIHENANESLSIGQYQKNNFPTFNGDDALVLYKSEEAIDRFGQVGVQEVWSGGSTGPEVWSRKPEISSGDADITAPFNIYDEWVFLGEDHTLGEHGQPSTPSADGFSIGDARDVTSGHVTVEGVVTARHNNTLHIQDDNHAIAVFRQSALPTLEVGDRVLLSGDRGDYANLKQLQNPNLIAIKSSEDVEGRLVQLYDNFHDFESMLVTFEDITFTDSKTAGADATNYSVAGHSLEVRDENSILDLELQKLYSSVTGTLTIYHDTWQLIPRSREDIVDNINQVVTPTVDVIPSRVEKGTTIHLSTDTENTEIYYTTDGSVPTRNSHKYEGDITLDTIGEVTIQAIAFSDTLTESEMITLTYEVQESGYMMIHEIQGEGHVSPYDGAYVSDVYGIVTYYYMNRGHHYFHIQTPDDETDNDPNTSEGVLVFTESEHPFVEVGDEVLVSGMVTEFFIDGFDDKERTDLPVTQINAREYLNGDIEILSRGNVLPAPILITKDTIPTEIASLNHFNEGLEDDYFDRDNYAIDFWESLEGMRVQVDDVKAVAPQEHGDVIVTLDDNLIDTDSGGIKLTEDGPSSQLIHFRLHDNRHARDFPVKTGDVFEGPLIGHVSYAYQHYKLNIDLETLEERLVEGDTTPRVTYIEPSEDKLTIASYNLENFSHSDVQTSDEKAEKLARAIVSDLKAPDIIGVTEVQDEDGPIDSGNPDATKSYERLVQAIVDYGGPEYHFAFINPIDKQDGGQPGANIQVGFLYNPLRVEFDETIPHGTATDAVDYYNHSLTYNPGRIDPTNPILQSTRKPLVAQFEFKDEQILVIVNHWNSKLGDEPHWGRVQPADTGSEDKRISISLLVQAFVETVLEDNPDANIISIGDFNAFQWEESMLIQEDLYFYNMIHEVPDGERYTYIYNGSSQVLDHAFVTHNLVEQTEIDMVKINADFTDMHGRASDHDPVLIQIDFSAH